MKNTSKEEEKFKIEEKDLSCNKNGGAGRGEEEYKLMNTSTIIILFINET